jgi:ribosomal protein L7/L12
MNTVKRAADSLPAAAMMALVEGRIVEAIRAVREAEDLGFREAKKIVERYIMCDAALRAQWVARREASRCLRAISSVQALSGRGRRSDHSAVKDRSRQRVHPPP